MRSTTNFNKLFKDYIAQTGYEEVEIYSWPQMWSSTACGFGGIGGCAMTIAQTVVIRDIYSEECCVFINDRFAYRVSLHNSSFKDKFLEMRAPGLKEAIDLGICLPCK